MAEPKDITYPNALASNGKIVNVADADFQDRSLTFTCIGCGEPMVAVHRTTGKSHFRHLNSNPSCNPQTYLHRLAKKIFKERFDSGRSFQVTYKSREYCKYFNICHYRDEGEDDRCIRDGRNTIDLHSLYDTCQEEVGYKGYIADLLLTNSQKPEQEPLFLEIAVTHKCDESKIASGIPIIELDIQSEEDIRLPIKEEGDIRQGLKPSLFYNWDRSVISKSVYDTQKLTSYEIIEQYRSLQCITRNGSCRDILERSYQRIYFGLYVRSDFSKEMGEEELKKLAYSHLALNGKYPYICLFCNKARHKDPETKKFGEFFCKKAKDSQLSWLNCPGFEYDPDVALDITRHYHLIPALYLGLKK